MIIRHLTFVHMQLSLFASVVAAGEIDFNRDIRPILSDNCFQCHGPDAGHRDSELRLDLREHAFADLGDYAAVVAGHPEKSELIARVFSEDEDSRMPPADSNLILSQQQKESLRQWITEGAKWSEHWAFIPPKASLNPEVEHTDWPVNAIDRFILARMEKAGMSPSPKADREQLLRRVTMDLTGLPPTIPEIDAYLADHSADAYRRVVDRLLGSDAHAERLALDWMDLSRYADSHGLHSDGARRMWPWRDWVLDAFKTNMPYDQFVVWQLAGDLLPDATRDQILATAFHRNSPMTAEGGVIDEEVRLNYVFDRAETTSIAFLGLTMQCARCHDHKFDPLTQKEFYSLSAFFNNVQELGMIGDDGDYPPLLNLADADSDTEVKLHDLDLQIAEAESKLKRILRSATAIHGQGSSAKIADVVASLPECHRFRLDEASNEIIEIEKKEESKDATAKDSTEDETDEEEETNEKEKQDNNNIKHVWQLDGNPSATSADVPKFIEGVDGKAIYVSGEYGFLSLKGVGVIESNELLSAAMWIAPENPPLEDPNSKSAQEKTRTLLCNSGQKNEFWRGWDFRLQDDNRLALRLVHILPNDCLHVRTTSAIPLNRWSHVAFTYNGSGKAEGVQLFVDGRLVKTEILLDRLTRSIYPVKHEIDFPLNDGKAVRVGKSFRQHTGEVGIFLGAIDDIRLFSATLTPLEIASLFDSYESTESLATDSISVKNRRQDEVIRSNQDYAKTSKELLQLRGKRLELLTNVPQIMVMHEMPEPRKTFVLDRGDYTQPREQVSPETPASVLEFPANLPRNRLGFARWLFLPDNPLTARVAVNRYWQILFGEGLVRTPDDLGTQGEPPTHPELLDWLAVHFRESNWDVRDLIRQMVLSATYCQSSQVSLEMLEQDPGNRLLTRSPSYRLPAEAIRDHALATSGLLVKKLGGPSVKPYQPTGLWREKNSFSQHLLNYEQGKGEELYRRSLYTFVRRTSPPPAMSVFDAPNRSVCTVKREVTNTPLQALVLLNDPQFVEAARVLAERVQREGGEAVEQQITLAFRLITGRQPAPKQLQVLQHIYDQQLQRFRQDLAAAEAVLSIGQRPADTLFDTARTAALTIVGNTLMNYDEFYMKR